MMFLPSFYFVYRVSDPEKMILELVKECSTRGEAVEWIKAQGPGEIYTVQEMFKP